MKGAWENLMEAGRSATRNASLAPDRTDLCPASMGLSVSAASYSKFERRGEQIQEWVSPKRPPWLWACKQLSSQLTQGKDKWFFNINNKILMRSVPIYRIQLYQMYLSLRVINIEVFFKPLERTIILAALYTLMRPMLDFKNLS